MERCKASHLIIFVLIFNEFTSVKLCRKYTLCENNSVLITHKGLVILVVHY